MSVIYIWIVPLMLGVAAAIIDVWTRRRRALLLMIIATVAITVWWFGMPTPQTGGYLMGFCAIAEFLTLVIYLSAFGLIGDLQKGRSQSAVKALTDKKMGSR